MAKHYDFFGTGYSLMMVSYHTASLSVNY